MSSWIPAVLDPGQVSQDVVDPGYRKRPQHTPPTDRDLTPFKPSPFFSVMASALNSTNKKVRKISGFLSSEQAAPKNCIHFFGFIQKNLRV